MGIYRGSVSSITTEGVFVKVPILGGNDLEYGPCDSAGLSLVVGSRVLCGTVDEIPDDIVILGSSLAGTQTINGIWVFDTVAQRNAALPAPPSGTLAWTNDTDFLYSYYSGGWHQASWDEARILALEAGSAISVTDSSTIDFTKVGGNITASVKAESIPLNDLSNVTVPAPSTNHVLQYNGTAWVNVNPNLDFLTDVAISSPTTAQVLRYNGSGWVNAALSLDDLSDVAITSVATGHFLRYNGTNFVNIATLDVVAAATTTDAITVQVSGDTQKRSILNGDGSWEMGSGSAAVDTKLYRSGVGALKTDGSFNAVGDIQHNSITMPRGIVGTSSISGTSSGGVTTTETKDPIGDCTFTAETGRSYRVVYVYTTVATTSASQARLNIRDGGGSSPTNTSTVIGIPAFAYNSLVNNAGADSKALSFVKNDFSAGTHTIAAFIIRESGSGSVQLTGPGGHLRQLWVEDIGPA